MSAMYEDHKLVTIRLGRGSTGLFQQTASEMLCYNGTLFQMVPNLTAVVDDWGKE